MRFSLDDMALSWAKKGKRHASCYFMLILDNLKMRSSKAKTPPFILPFFFIAIFDLGLSL